VKKGYPWRDKNGQIVVNISRLMDFARCEQRAFWRWWKGIVPDEKLIEDLTFGTAWHKAMESVYKKESSWCFSEAFEAFKRAIPKGYNSEDEFESVDYAELLLEKYFDTWEENDKAEFKSTIIVEQEMCFEIADMKIVARPDVIVEKTGPLGGFWLIQHKTISSNRNVSDYSMAFTKSWHERAYALAGEKFLGKKIRGSILNGARKTSPGRIATKAQLEVGENIVLGKRVLDPDWNPFFRFEVALSSYDMRAFEDDMIAMRRRIEEAESTGLFPRNPGACTDFHRVCAYRNLCGGVPVTLGGWKDRERDYVDSIREKGKGRA
jgi:hypothetical protein